MESDQSNNKSEEPKLVEKRYKKRREYGVDGIYNRMAPNVYMEMLEKDRAIIEILRDAGYSDASRLKMLEIGCGTGLNLLRFITLGFQPENLSANELLPDRIALLRKNLPDSVSVYEGDASILDVPDSTFDIVYQSTVFTSILDEDFKRKLADKMWRLVKPGGGILWYDFMYNNPNNSDVKGISLRAVRDLFPKGKIVHKKVTLAPPISRRVSRISPKMYRVFNSMSLLRTHVICWVGKY